MDGETGRGLGGDAASATTVPPGIAQTASPLDRTLAPATRRASADWLSIFLPRFSWSLNRCSEGPARAGQGGAAFTANATRKAAGIQGFRPPRRDKPGGSSWVSGW
jgi:hypothetical protein